MASTSATSVRSSPRKASSVKREEPDELPSENIVTEEMIKEESDLHESSQQKDLVESSSQVPPVLYELF